MFQRDEIRQAVRLQEKSYRLLRWVGRQLKSGALKFDQIHQAMSMGEAARQWLGRHWDSLPQDARPERREELEPFAYLMASYLATSFELKPREPYLETYCGCYCRWCSYLAAGPRLKVRKVTKKARRDAQELKAVYLQGLAEFLDRDVPGTRLLELAEQRGEGHHVSLATYGNELVRRTRYASQGEGILVLWREIAWEGHRPKEDFRLQAEPLWQAQEHLLEAIPKW